MIVNILGSTENALVQSDFAATSFVCNVGGLLEPTVQKATSLVGNGSTANPLAVKLSTDAGQTAVFGTDGGVLVAAAAPFTFSVNGTTGTAQPIASGDLLTIAQGNGIATVGSATDIVTVSARLSADAGNQVSFGTDGGLFSTAQTFTAATWNDATNELTLTLSNGNTVVIPIVDAIGTFLNTYSLAADSGPVQTITNGDTISILGGASLSSVASATDTVSVNLDLSADAGNVAVFGTDGNLYVPTPASFGFSISDGTTTEVISSGNTVNFADSASINFVVSATDTVTASVVVPTNTSACPSGYFVGAPV